MPRSLRKRSHGAPAAASAALSPAPETPTVHRGSTAAWLARVALRHEERAS